MQIKTFNSNRTLIKQLTKEEFYNLVSDKFTTIGYESSVGKRSEINGRIGVNKGIKGTGRSGRVTKKDILQHLEDQNNVNIDYKKEVT